VSDEAMVAAADRAARVWAAAAPGPILPGSDAHKAAFCRMLLDTHNPYKPSIIDWPELDLEARDRLVSLPIWDIAVQTEGKARLRVLSYGEEIADPLLKQAIELDGFEEGRHKEVLSNLVQAYGIRLSPEPEYLRPRDPEWAFMVTGFSECIDSVFAFGLFALAQRSGFFPPALVDTFEPAAPDFLGQNPRRLGFSRLGANRPRMGVRRCGRWGGGNGAPGQQLYPDGQQVCQCRRSFPRRTDRCVPGRERSPPLGI